MLKLLAIVVLYRLVTVRVTLRALKFQRVYGRNRSQIEAIKQSHPNDLQQAQKQIDGIMAASGVWPGISLVAPLLELLFLAAFTGFASSRSLFVGDGFLWVPDMGASSSSLTSVWIAMHLGRRILTRRLYRREAVDANLIRGLGVLGLFIVAVVWLFGMPAYLFAYGILTEVILSVTYLAYLLTPAASTVGPQGSPPGPAGAGVPAPSAAPSPPPSPTTSPATPYGTPPGSAFVPPGCATPKGTPVAASTPPGSARGTSPPPAAGGRSPLSAGAVNITSNPIPTNPLESPCSSEKPLNLQAAIDQACPGGTIFVPPPGKHIQGPIVINKAITIDGSESTVWASEGPVVTVDHDGVAIENLGVEITTQGGGLKGSKSCALQIAGTTNVSLRNVVLCGDAEGIPGEQGVWRYPRSIELGSIRAGVSHVFKLRLAAAVRCSLTSEISGVSLKPNSVSGREEIALHVDAFPPGTRLRGRIALKTPRLTRAIRIRADVVSDEQEGLTGTGQVVFEPDDWDGLLRASAEPTPPPAVAQPAEPRIPSCPAQSHPPTAPDSPSTSAPASALDRPQSGARTRRRKVVRGGDMGLFGEQNNPAE